MQDSLRRSPSPFHLTMSRFKNSLSEQMEFWCCCFTSSICLPRAPNTEISIEWDVKGFFGRIYSKTSCEDNISSHLRRCLIEISIRPAPPRLVSRAFNWLQCTSGESSVLSKNASMSRRWWWLWCKEVTNTATSRMGNWYAESRAFHRQFIVPTVQLALMANSRTTTRYLWLDSVYFSSCVC